MSSPASRSVPVSTQSVPEELLDAIASLTSPVLINHVVPDADALGAAFAMALAGFSDAARATMSLPPGSVSQRLAFLFDGADVAIAQPTDFAATDGFVVLDTAKKSRCNVGPVLKETDWSAGRPVINIDHHATNTRFGDVNWVVDQASSTCELVCYLLQAADRPISPLAASMLYAGIQTDTLGFSLPTTHASTLAAAAHLASCGADIAALGERLCRSQTRSEFDLLRVVYANTKVLAGGKLAYSSASHDEIHGAGCTAADIDEQINVPRSLDGVRLAMLFTEGNKGKTRINFRSSGDLAVLELANQFRGGGHRQAAGAVLDYGLNEAIEKVLPKAIEHLEKFAST